MARPLHYEEADAIYHVTIHSVDETTIVRSDHDRQHLIQAIHRTVKRFGWRCLAVSVLDTHYHLLVTTPEANLAAGMQYLTEPTRRPSIGGMAGAGTCSASGTAASASRPMPTCC